MLDENSQTVELPRPGETEITEHNQAPEMRKPGFLKGSLAMAICCGAPLLLLAAISVFGLSLGATASGALSVAAILACPVGMYLMMRTMSKK